jgi:hypothetical protein
MPEGMPLNVKPPSGLPAPPLAAYEFSLAKKATAFLGIRAPLQLPILPPKPPKLIPFFARQRAISADTSVDLLLLRPLSQRVLGEIEISSGLGDRLA